MVKKLAIAVILVLGLLVGVGAPAVWAVDAGNLGSDKCTSDLDPKQKAALGCDTSRNSVAQIAQNVINIVISLMGVIAVIYLVVAGQRYIVSNGDPGKVEQAKRMIIYTISGLAVALLAWVIVSWVLMSLS